MLVPGENRAAGIHVCNESVILPSTYNGSTRPSSGRSSPGVSHVSVHVLSRKYWPLLVQTVFFKIYVGQTALEDRDCVCEKRMLYPSEKIWVFQALGSWPRIFHRHALWPRLQPHVGKGNWELMQEMLVLWLLLSLWLGESFGSGWEPRIFCQHPLIKPWQTTLVACKQSNISVFTVLDSIILERTEKKSIISEYFLIQRRTQLTKSLG